MTDIDSKKRIKEAAHDLVMKYSIRSVSMDDIAASVGMSKKTLYQYYKDKDELVNAVVEGVIAENQCACTMHEQSADNAVHEIFLAIEMMIEMFRTMHPGIIFEMQKYYPSAFKKFQKHKMEFLLQHMHHNLERGKAEDLYRPDVNNEIMARFRVESMLIPFNPEFQHSLNHYNLLQLEEQIILNFLFGLVNAKGHKLAMKYMAQRKKNIILK